MTEEEGRRLAELVAALDYWAGHARRLEGVPVRIGHFYRAAAHAGKLEAVIHLQGRGRQPPPPSPRPCFAAGREGEG